MRNRIRCVAACSALLSFAFAARAQGPLDWQLHAWPVDPLIKVFRDAPQPAPSAQAEGFAEVARGETATFQVVVNSPTGVTGLLSYAVPFTSANPAALDLFPRRPRFVGYVNVDRPIHTPPSDQLRPPPADYPDPLLEDETVDVPAGQNQPIWVTVPVPSNAAPGEYRGYIHIRGKVNKQQAWARVPLRLKVHDVAVRPQRLWVTNWFRVSTQGLADPPQPGTPAHDDILRRYARNMAEHRQNVALISPLSLCEFTAGPDGTIEMNFATFDRWVEIFKAEGVIGRIEGGHLGGRQGGWESSFVVTIRRINDGKVVADRVDPSSLDADAFYGRFLPVLVKHLKQRGWLDIYTQHLADEPIPSNAASYKAIAALVRKYAPELKIIEACHEKDLVGSIDVWVPMLDYLHRDFAHYQARQKAGEEVWFYTCVFPQGEYANRFIEQPLIKTRLLHWINYRYGLTGYLHWGWNWWSNDPMKITTPPHGGPPYLPAGDAWIVYPGRQGPLDSIRWEAMRDGIADYELLGQLAEIDKPAADRLAAAHVREFNQYETDVRAFRATRSELLRRLAGK